MIVVAVAVVAGLVTILNALAGYGGWMYQRGYAEAHAKAELDRRNAELEQRIAQLERELEDRPPPDYRPHRRRRR